jgi:hypothetical protein
MCSPDVPLYVTRLSESKHPLAVQSFATLSGFSKMNVTCKLCLEIQSAVLVKGTMDVIKFAIEERK